jgi:hypothetical protein
MRRSYVFGAMALMTLSACVQTRPTVQVMPGHKSFVSFQNDQATCRRFADQAVADQAHRA